MIICITGGRDFADRTLVYRTLDAIHRETPITTLIEGGAPGADRLATFWAIDHRVPVRTFHAEWIKDGRKAGPLRNARMIAERPDLVVAFPGGRGTADTCALARKAAIRLLEVKP